MIAQGDGTGLLSHRNLTLLDVSLVSSLGFVPSYNTPFLLLPIHLFGISFSSVQGCFFLRSLQSESTTRSDKAGRGIFVSRLGIRGSAQRPAHPTSRFDGLLHHTGVHVEIRESPGRECHDYHSTGWNLHLNPRVSRGHRYRRGRAALATLSTEEFPRARDG